MDQTEHLKAKLRQWEARFAAKHGRPPTKRDAAKVAEVAAAYQAYGEMRRQRGSKRVPGDGDSFGAHLNRAAEVKEVKEDFREDKENREEDNSAQSLNALIGPRRTATTADKHASWIPAAKKGALDHIDEERRSAAEEAVNKYLQKTTQKEGTQHDNTVKPVDSLSADNSSKTPFCPPPSAVLNIPPEIQQQQQHHQPPSPGFVVAPGSFSLSRQKSFGSRTSKSFTLSTSFLKSSSSFLFPPSILENAEEETDSTPPTTATSATIIPTTSSSNIETGWTNNVDDSESESVIAARRNKSIGKRAKKMPNGMKVTRVMKAAEREAKADYSRTKQKASSFVVHSEDDDDHTNTDKVVITGAKRGASRSAPSEKAPSKRLKTRKSIDNADNDIDGDDLELIATAAEASLAPADSPECRRKSTRTRKSMKVFDSSDNSEEESASANDFDDETDDDEDSSDGGELDNTTIAFDTKSTYAAVSEKSANRDAKAPKKQTATKRKTVPKTKSASTQESGWGKAEDKKLRDHSGYGGGGGGGSRENNGIGSSNFRTLKLQKSKFGKGGGGRFGGKGGRYNNGSKLKSYGASNSYSGYRGTENPWHTKDAEEVVQSLYDEAERKRLLELPDLNFFTQEEDENLCPVNSSFFDVVPESNFYVNLHSALKSLTGLDSFRPGQEGTIKRILNGQSTILVLPTGGGKSLCYQLPAYILRKISRERNQQCITLVVSPMVSLMQDQMRCLPPKLTGICLSSNQSATEYRKLADQLANDQIDILYVTPEKLQTEGFKKLVETQRISTVRLACIDEVHCLTEWSHNFRTSYLSLNTVFQEVIGVKCVLGLTATATIQARKSVIDMLSLTDDAIISESKMRNNLKMTVSKVSRSDNRELLLENLLKLDVFSAMSSIIIYTMFQGQADEIAKYLRIRNFDADSYHAGKPSMERALIQEKFMQNRLQIIVATVAFGLGINKQDVRAVIHFNIPKSLENYSQEIGRSGRDGKDSYCHVFLCPDDYVRHRSFAYSEGVDEAAVWRFILKVFGNAAALSGDGRKKEDKKKADKAGGVGGVSVGRIQDRLTMLIPIEATEKELDMKESVLATLLTYMEGFDGRPIRVFPAIYGEYMIHFNKKSAFDLAETNPIVEAILRNSEKTKGKMTINTLKICGDANVSPSVLGQTLAELKRKKEIQYEGLSKAFHIELPNLGASQLDKTYLDRMRTLLTSKMRDLETSRVAKLDVLYETLLAASVDSLGDVIWDASSSDFCGETVSNEMEVTSDVDEPKSNAKERMERLKETVERYFETETGTLKPETLVVKPGTDDDDDYEAKCLLGVKSGFRDPTLANRSDKCKKVLRIDINDFIVQNAAVFTSGRAIARVFHGISSPKFPAYDWYKNKAWNSYSHFNFGELVKIASKALMEYRMRTGRVVDEVESDQD